MRSVSIIALQLLQFLILHTAYLCKKIISNEKSKTYQNTDFLPVKVYFIQISDQNSVQHLCFTNPKVLSCFPLQSTACPLLYLDGPDNVRYVITQFIKQWLSLAKFADFYWIHRYPGVKSTETIRNHWTFFLPAHLSATAKKLIF